jgi:hypothetical protein
MTATEAIELLTRVLDEEYGALPDPEPDDHPDAEEDRPQIERLRAVISFLRALAAAA